MLDTHLYLSGGNDNEDEEASACVYAFDIKHEKWQLEPEERIPDMNQARSFHSSCSLLTKLFVFFGFDESDFIETIEMLDLRK